jgi:hypothetical protein
MSDYEDNLKRPRGSRTHRPRQREHPVEDDRSDGKGDDHDLDGPTPSSKQSKTAETYKPRRSKAPPDPTGKTVIRTKTATFYIEAGVPVTISPSSDHPVQRVRSRTPPRAEIVHLRFRRASTQTQLSSRGANLEIMTK